MAHNENSTPRVSNQNRTEEEERGGEEEAQMEEKLLQDVMNISLFNTSDIPKTIPEEDDDVVVEFDPDEEGQEEELIGLKDEEEPTLVCERQEPITAQVLTQFIVSPTVDNAGVPGINVEMDSYYLPPQFRHPADLQAQVDIIKATIANTSRSFIEGLNRIDDLAGQISDLEYRYEETAGIHCGLIEDAAKKIDDVERVVIEELIAVREGLGRGEKRADALQAVH